MSKSEVSEVILTNTRVTEAAVKGSCNANYVARYSTFPDNIQTKRKKKEMIHIRIRSKKD